MVKSSMTMANFCDRLLRLKEEGNSLKKHEFAVTLAPAPKY